MDTQTHLQGLRWGELMASVFFMKYEGRRKGSFEELGTESWREAGGRWWWGWRGGMVGARRSTEDPAEMGEMDLRWHQPLWVPSAKADPV